MYRAIEASYPITFRESDAKHLGDLLAQHASIALIGMKRVGISNFLRFFLSHPDIGKTYIHNSMTHTFVAVDLNDLVERDIVPFWTLVLTRLVDVVVAGKLPDDMKAMARRLFRESIQLKDLFFTIDSIRKILLALDERNIYTTFFLIRFDRIAEKITPEFFNNLQGLRDAAKGHLSYVFTSYRPLSELAPSVITKPALSVFVHNLSIKPADEKDLRMILATFEARYHTKLPKKIIDWLLRLSGGHVQYLQLSLLKLRDMKKLPDTEQELLNLLATNEEIMLQSEELFENLTKSEQEAILRKKSTPYTEETGMMTGVHIFSPLFAQYVESRSAGKTKPQELTKKEHQLFIYLKNHLGDLCERYDIVNAVWKDEAELGISDWAIDRLVARVRAKLKNQKSPYEIVTVITRGYKLIKS